MRLSLAMSAALLCAHGVALGEPSDAELRKARRLYAEGLEAARAGQWTRACASFLGVSETRLNAAVSYQLGRCKRANGRVLEALEHFKSAADLAEKEKDAEGLAAAKQAHAELLAAAPRIQVDGLDGKMQVEIDGVSVQGKGPFLVDPGAHLLRVRDGSVLLLEQTVSVGLGAVKVLGAVVRPSAPKVVPSLQAQPKRDEDEVPAAAIVLFTVGGASALGCAVLGTISGIQLAALNSQCAGSQCAMDLEGKKDLGEATQWAAIATGVTAGVALGLGAVFLALDAPSPSAGPVRASVLVGPVWGIGLSTEL